MIKRDRVTVGPFESNCWVISGPGNEAIVIDPGAEPDAIHRHLVRHKLKVALYICTHGHVDHVSALAAMQKQHPAPAAMHADDYRWAFTFANSMEPYYSKPDDPVSMDRLLRDGDAFTDADIAWSVMSTPGHSPGGICICIPDAGVVFTGDTLFAGSVGRTDLPGGDSRALSASLKRLAGLPDDTAVCPGHGPETTIGEEKRSNYFMRSPAKAGEMEIP